MVSDAVTLNIVRRRSPPSEMWEGKRCENEKREAGAMNFISPTYVAEKNKECRIFSLKNQTNTIQWTHPRKKFALLPPKQTKKGTDRIPQQSPFWKSKRFSEIFQWPCPYLFRETDKLPTVKNSRDPLFRAQTIFAYFFLFPTFFALESPEI